MNNDIWDYVKKESPEMGAEIERTHRTALAIFLLIPLAAVIYFLIRGLLSA